MKKLFIIILILLTVKTNCISQTKPKSKSVQPISQLAYSNELVYDNDIANFQGRPFSGILLEEKTNNQLGEFKNGLKNGMFREYYPNKKISKQVKYVNNFKVDNENYYHQNGRVKVVYLYENGTLILDTYPVFNEKGIIEIQEIYEYAPCNICRGSGFQSCSDCNGAGGNPCQNCTNGNQRCYECDGKGKTSCYNCNGYGQLRCNNCNGGGKVTVNCTICNGSGYYNGKLCYSCNGNGRFVTGCKVCGGNYINAGSGKLTCSSCVGTGMLKCEKCFAKGTVYCSNCSGTAYIKCNRCNGDGNLKSFCQSCIGSGKSKEMIKHQMKTTIIYNEDKKKKSETNYLDDVKNGDEIIYNLNGTKKVTYTYQFGKIKSGTYIIYNDSSIAIKQEEYTYPNCNNCNGTGRIECGNCSGLGRFKCDYCIDGKLTCKDCNGKGALQRCDQCGRAGNWSDNAFKKFGGGGGYECPYCGNGWRSNCTKCSSRGYITCPSCNGNTQIACRICNGTGRSRAKCGLCSGKGLQEDPYVKEQNIN